MSKKKKEDIFWRKGRVKKIKMEFAAGGIIFRKKKNKIQIAFILDPYGKWAFAKGHLHKNESLEEAARREVEEETGLKNLKIIRKLGKMDFWFRRQSGTLVHKFVHYFLMQAPASAKFVPQVEEKIFKAKWVDLEKALDFCGYKNTKPLLKKAILMIKKLNK